MVSLIPTFQVGQRVILHYHSYEYLCPHCHQPAVGIDEEPYDYETEVLELGKGQECFCYCCKLPSILDSGWYVVQGKRNRLGVPYTLLEATNATP